jgi:hypothetical protein
VKSELMEGFLRKSEEMKGKILCHKSTLSEPQYFTTDVQSGF